MEEREKGPYLSRIEWEGLQDRWEIADLKESPALPLGSEKIEVWRDEQYKIEAKVIGTPSEFTGDLLPNHGEPGTVIPNFEVEGSDLYKTIDYRLSNCVVGKVSLKASSGAPIGFEGPVSISRVRRTLLRREPRKTAWLTEWYLNAYRGSTFIYPRLVKRELKEEYRREREFLGEDVTFEGDWRGGSDLCAFVKTPDVSFIVQRVPDELGPPWSKALGIEYRDEWGGVPDDGDREAIANVISFLMGRPLIGLGHTSFDQRGYPSEQVAISPPQDNLAAICRRSDNPPVKLDQDRPTDRFEVLLRELVPRYLALKEELSLNEVVWGYWMAEEMPLGADLPLLATRVEILKNAWYQSKRSKTKGVYIPKGEFDDLLETEFKAVATKLESMEYRDRILRRMRGAFQMGVNESFDFFLEEIGLAVGEVERKAIRARNRMAHGSSELFDERAYQKMVDDKLAYRTLFNRILLKIMNYEGTYVDRSASQRCALVLIPSYAE